MSEENNEKSALVPRLRFPEFREAGEWEKKELGEVINLEYGSSLSEEKRKAGTIPVVGSNGIVGYHDEHLVGGPAIVIGRKGSVGQVNWIDRDCYPIDTTYYVNNKNPQGCLLPFLSVLLRRSNLPRLKDPSAVPGLNRDSVHSLISYFPKPKEQQKIADCLSSLDELITAETHKLDTLKTHKKGLMQQLFPREGETVPRLRFPEFRDAGEWQGVSLSSQVDLISGLHLAPDEYADTGEIPYFTGPSDFSNELTSVSKWTVRGANAGRAGDILITVKGNGVGELLYQLLDEVAIGRQLMAVRPRKSYGRFVFHFLATQRQRLIALASGNLIPGLSRGDILGLEVFVPKHDEQQKIADCLSSHDDLITAQTQKIEALKIHKKGLMQQLFPVLDEVSA